MTTKEKMKSTRWMAFFPNADLVVIPDAGHEMFKENPADSIAAIREYLND